MKITGVGINRPLNKTQGSIKKIVSVAKPLNMGIGQVSGQPTNDVDDNFGSGQLGNGLADLIDVSTLFADHNTRTSREDGDAALLVRTLDHNFGNRSLLQQLHEHRTDADVFMQQRGIFALAGDPTAVPRAVDAEAQPDRINFLTHRLLLKPLRQFRGR